MVAEPQLVICSCPTIEIAEKIAEQLMEHQLAACIQILPTVTSIYRWQDKIERSPEVLLYIKTEQRVYPQLQAMICQLHPYEVPEIIALSITQGLPDYLHWMNTQCYIA